MSGDNTEWEVKYHSEKLAELMPKLQKGRDEMKTLSGRLNLQSVIVGCGAAVVYLEAVLGAGTAPWYNTNPETAGAVVAVGGIVVAVSTLITRVALSMENPGG